MTERIEPEQTFCGVPFCTDLGTLEAEVAVLGAPHGTPYEPGTPSHAANGAAAVRAALGWYSTNPEQFDFDSMGPLFGGARVVDCGDVVGDLHDGAANRQHIEAAVRGIRARGAVPLLLGGDDSVPIPLFRAYSEARGLTIVQIDAHIDWRDQVKGVREGFSSTMRRASEMAQIERIIQIGARGPGSARAAELDDARAWGAFPDSPPFRYDPQSTINRRLPGINMPFGSLQFPLVRTLMPRKRELLEPWGMCRNGGESWNAPQARASSSSAFRALPGPRAPI